MVLLCKVFKSRGQKFLKNEMTKKLDRSLRQPLIELVITYEEAQAKLDKEDGHERIGRIAGFVGLIITFFWIIEPVETTRFVGDLGLTLAFIAMIFGAWCWFSPPSRDPNRPEAASKRLIRKRLEDLGFEPYIVHGHVFLKDTGREIDPRDSDNFESSAQNDAPF